MCQRVFKLGHREAEATVILPQLLQLTVKLAVPREALNDVMNPADMERGLPMFL